jgi:hypothetical protein
VVQEFRLEFFYQDFSNEKIEGGPFADLQQEAKLSALGETGWC